jgi:predicted MFS family arabinose efflux permease
MIPRLVPREYTTNAIALTSAAFNVMRTLGPAIASLVLALFTFGDLYVLQAVMLVWVMWCTSQINVTTHEGGKHKTSMREELVEGFAAVKRDRVVLYILVISLAVFVWGMPFQGVFIPLIAKRELGFSTAEAGLLISLVGIGALAGALVVATVGENLRRRGYAMLGMIVAFCAGLLVFANVHSIYAAAPALILTGAMQTSFMSLNNAFVLGRTPQELHGRVLSLFHLDRGLVPLGATIGGLLASALDPAAAQTVMALICLGFSAALFLVFPALRRIA